MLVTLTRIKKVNKYLYISSLEFIHPEKIKAIT